MLKDFLNENKYKYKENFDLSKYCTYKAGGVASFIVYPKDTAELINLIKYLRKQNILYDLIGNGSNVLYSDSFYNGVLINLKYFNNLLIQDNMIKVGAGYPLINLSYKALLNSLTGLEFAYGIPGTVGGAIYMNAGAYKSDMGYITKRCKVLTPDLKVITLSNAEMKFKYRTSFIKEHKGYILLEATIILNKGKKEAIEAVMNDRKERRKSSQPLEYPSAGSVFRNPENTSAGLIIDEAKLKGYQIGGAAVSTKHGNFIVNMSDAKASDIKKLISYVRNEIKEKYNIDLICEQEFKNFEDEEKETKN